MGSTIAGTADSVISNLAGTADAEISFSMNCFGTITDDLYLDIFVDKWADPVCENYTLSVTVQ